MIDSNATDNRTTELREKLTERGVKWWPMYNNGYYEDRDTEFVVDGKKHTAHEWGDGLAVYNLTPEQAIAATLGRPKAKSHLFGYECDTGCCDCTRCECGCINDISSKYCNDCGGEIEIDESAEKECYDGYSKHTVFAKKHDDGSLELCERRYVPEDAATLGSEPPYDELLRCLENDWHISASWDGLRKFWCIELTEEGVKLRDATHGTLTAELETENEQLRMAKTLLSDSEQAKIEHIGKLEQLVRDMDSALVHGNCYRWCKRPCNLLDDGKCNFHERMKELGIDMEGGA